MTMWDVAIIGAGMAGASLAHSIGRDLKVLLLEGEDQPGYHATGRSAAFWTESYGGPLVQPLTTASGAFLFEPPMSFSERGFLHARSALHIGRAGDEPKLNSMLHGFEAGGVVLEQLDKATIARHVPGLRVEWSQGLLEPSCCDIDVGALHQAYLRSAAKIGVKVQCHAKMQAAQFRQGMWIISTNNGEFHAKKIVNAAGAWADDVAAKSDIKPLGIQPYRRTIVQLSVEPEAPKTLPLVIALDGSFYFKSAPGGKIWLSPHDETPSNACDAAADENDVALAVDRFEKVVDWKIQKLEHKWAGLRSFAPDRLPVIGRDARNEAFFWFAGQGGFGIQTAPAAAELAASLLLIDRMPPAGIDALTYDPSRFA
jgi:D-arginine dehydrogenase